VHSIPAKNLFFSFLLSSFLSFLIHFRFCFLICLFFSAFVGLFRSRSYFASFHTLLLFIYLLFLQYLAILCYLFPFFTSDSFYQVNKYVTCILNFTEYYIGHYSKKQTTPTAKWTLHIRNKIVTWAIGIGPFRTLTVYICFTIGVVHGPVPY
jgi:hypothetical protein